MAVQNKLGKRFQDGEKNPTVAKVLTVLLGILGLDRAYYGYFLLGFIKMFTWGGFLIWWILDIIAVFKGTMKPNTRRNPPSLLIAAFLLIYPVLGVMLISMGLIKTLKDIIIVFILLVPGMYGMFMLIERTDYKRRQIAVKWREVQLLEDKQKDRAHLFGTNKFGRFVVIAENDEKEYEKTKQILAKAFRDSAAHTSEINESVAGGIAHGLFGLGAGIVATGIAMEQNQKIREENERNKQFAEQQAYQVATSMKDALVSHKEYVKGFKDLARRHKVSTKWSIESLFSQLSFTKPLVMVNPEYGSVSVRVDFSVQDQTAWIDGAVRGKLYTPEHKLAGCVYLPLPLGGTLDINTSLSGDCASPLFGSSIYAVEFEPIDLWRYVSPNDISNLGNSLSEEQHSQQVEALEKAYENELKQSIAFIEKN